MAWFKVDDNFYDHPKVDELSLEAVGVWLLCGTYSARHLTDGFIPTRRAYRMGADEHVLEELTESGLWHEVEGGYQFHNWAEYQPTRDSVEESRKKERDRKREYRRNKRGQYTGQQPDAPKVSQRDNTRTSQVESHQPDPTRPDLNLKELPKGSSKKKPATRIPDGWEPSQRVRDDLATKHPTVDIYYEYQKFCDYWRAESGAKARKHDWDATFRNWVRRADENQKNRPQQFLTGAEKRAQQSMAHIQAMTDYQPTNPFEQGAKQIDTPRNRQLSGNDQPA